MKYLVLTLFIILMTEFTYCQSSSVKIIYESNRKDKATKLNETKNYFLKKVAINSDFNYLKLDDINEHRKDSLMAIFEPVNGHYKYYQFLATFIGEAYNADGPRLFKEFHDILIIKTDKNNKIFDAYQYTLEWGEYPFDYDLYKSSIKKISLTNNMDISLLKFKQTYSWGGEADDEDKELKECGIIKLR